MAVRNYYVVLGVPRSETPQGIRAAFRDLAKRYHPDRSGPAGERRFREVVEAYEVLSDPERRRSYNDSLAAGEPQAPSWASGPAPEPLRPRADVFDPPEFIHPSFPEVRDDWRRNFTGVGVPKAERPRVLDLELVLTPEEARFGCTVPVGIPVVRRCRACQGTGRDWLFPCLACGGEGWTEEAVTVELRIPAVRPGSLLEVPLDDLGVSNLVLRFRARL